MIYRRGGSQPPVPGRPTTVGQFEGSAATSYTYGAASASITRAMF
ncbi:hypothetical protein [Caldilinea sp.]|jgi:hypothetical protein|nr:hypothetical protein [Caldilinea sp.]GIV74414.1 MAG: hypothetical protein KatS3mg049_2970 [Caldilinea sp.]